MFRHRKECIHGRWYWFRWQRCDSRRCNLSMAYMNLRYHSWNMLLHRKACIPGRWYWFHLRKHNPLPYTMSMQNMMAGWEEGATWTL